MAIAVCYLRAGLERGELCACVVDDGGTSILAALASEGVDVEAATGAGRLAILEKPLSQGIRPQQMLGWVDQHAGEARGAGFAGFGSSGR